MTALREEYWPSLYGTRLRSQKNGLCRVRHLYPTRLSAIVGDKPIGALSDVWFRIVDDRVLEWSDDVEVEVLDD